MEEAQTIRAATAARKKWEARNGEFMSSSLRNHPLVIITFADESKAKEYRQSLETELYGLPPSKLAESIATKRKYVPSSYRRELSTAGPGIEDRIRMLSVGSKSGAELNRMVSPTVSPPDIGVLAEEETGPALEDRIRMLSVSSKPDAEAKRGGVLSPEISVLAEQEENGVLAQETLGTESSLPLPHQEKELSPAGSLPISASVSISANSSPTPPISHTSSDPASPLTCQGNSVDITASSHEQTILSPQSSEDKTSATAVLPPPANEQPTQQQGNDGVRIPSPHSNGADQLKVLTVASRPNAGSEKREVSPARAERSDYEKITMEAAAISREKWKQSEGMCDWYILIASEASSK